MIAVARTASFSKVFCEEPCRFTLDGRIMFGSLITISIYGKEYFHTTDLFRSQVDIGSTDCHLNTSRIAITWVSSKSIDASNAIYIAYYN